MTGEVAMIIADMDLVCTLCGAWVLRFGPKVLCGCFEVDLTDGHGAWPQWPLQWVLQVEAAEQIQVGEALAMSTGTK